MNNLDKNQEIHSNKFYKEILLNGPESYDGFINPNSIWYWMHTYCMEHIEEFFQKIPPSYFFTGGDGYCGREAGYIKKFGHKVHASDIETCLIKLAKDKGLIDEYSMQDMNALTFADNTFDFSLVKEALHHLSMPYRGIYELLRVSKKGLILIEPVGDSYNFNHFEGSGNYSYTFSKNELVKVGLALGYKHFLVTSSYVFFGFHNNDNINSGKIEEEKKRLIQLDKSNKIKPLIIFIFLKDKMDFDLFDSKIFEKINS